MYQTQIEMAELRQQEIVAWAAQERRAQAATRGQKSLFARLALSLSNLFSRPQTQAMPVRASKQRASKQRASKQRASKQRARAV